MIKLFRFHKLKDNKNSLTRDINELKKLKKDLEDELKIFTDNITNLQLENKKYQEEIKINKELLSYYSNYFNQFLNDEIERELLCIKGMTGYEYEEYIAKLLSYSYFDKINVTKFSGDHGVDIVAYHGEKKNRNSM